MSFGNEDVVRLRAVFGRMSRVLNRDNEAGGISRTQLSVLALIVRLGPLSVGELAEAEAVNPTMLSRILSKLEDGGLITRFADPLDRRVSRVEVTEHGRHTYNHLRTERARLLAEAIDELEPYLREQLLQALPALEALALHSQTAGARINTGVSP